MLDLSAFVPNAFGTKADAGFGVRASHDAQLSTFNIERPTSNVELPRAGACSVAVPAAYGQGAGLRYARQHKERARLATTRNDAALEHCDRVPYNETQLSQFALLRTCTVPQDG